MEIDEKNPPCESSGSAPALAWVGGVRMAQCHAPPLEYRLPPYPLLPFLDLMAVPLSLPFSGMSLATVSTSATSLTSNLTIMAVERHLAGLYTCHAQNSEGINSSYAYINLAGTYAYISLAGTHMIVYVIQSLAGVLAHVPTYF